MQILDHNREFNGVARPSNEGGVCGGGGGGWRVINDSGKALQKTIYILSKQIIQQKMKVGTK